MTAASSFTIVPLDERLRPAAQAAIAREWGGLTMVTRGVLHDMRDLPGRVALRESDMIGLATYRLDGGECEIMSLNSWVEGIGVGTALLDAVETAAREAGCHRVWLITTNDNLPALGFYQRRGYRLVALYPGAVDAARRLKPQIPLVGLGNIPLHDEIELGKGL